ncbi:MAG: cytochrome c biogenesis CcdA family protein [Bacillota bacterium]
MSIISAFLAGLLSFFSPCVFPLIPGYISYIANDSNKRIKILTRSLGFVIGFSIVFILLGATASFVGNIFLQYKDILMKFGGIIIILFGLQMIGLFNLNFLNKNKRFKLPKSVNWISSILIGMAFGAGWTPCVGPILGSILVFASTKSTIYEGVLLLTSYSLGIGIPFLLTALLLNQLNKFLSKVESKLNLLKKIGGVILIIFGLLIFTDKLFIITNYFY